LMECSFVGDGAPELIEGRGRISARSAVGNLLQEA
jgi:hypothetical protein